jgi:hypothetical protein
VSAPPSRLSGLWLATETGGLTSGRSDDLQASQHGNLDEVKNESEEGGRGEDRGHDRSGTRLHFDPSEG